MSRLGLLLAATAAIAATPAVAQHEGHAAAAEPPASEAEAQDPHAGHVMPAPADRPASPADPHAGHTIVAETQDGAKGELHGGHVMPASPEAPAQEAADPHAGHRTGEQAAPPAAALSGPDNAADLFFPPEQMAAARQALLGEHGDLPNHRVLLERFEASLHEGRDTYLWDVQAWYGGDIDKLWLKSEGEGTLWDGPTGAEFQALWSHAVDPWFDLQLGVRQDLREGPERTHLVAGFQGLAPYWFEVQAFAFLSHKGDLTARFEAEYDLRLTQALILQPRTELDIAAQDIPELRVGSGLSTGEIGARLRYELFPDSGPAVVAPYIGLAYERAFGQTADYRRADGSDTGGWNLLVGVRTWF